MDETDDISLSSHEVRLSKRFARAIKNKGLNLDELIVTGDAQYWRDVISTVQDHGGDGRNEVIAILDSGCQSWVPHIDHRKSVDLTGEGLVDTVGHGTVIGLLIGAIAPRAQHYHVKLFDSRGKIPGKTLEERTNIIHKALEHVTRTGATIVNISWNALTKLSSHSSAFRPGMICHCPICSIITDFVSNTGVDVFVSEGNFVKRETGSWSCPAAAAAITPVFAVKDGQRCYDANLGDMPGINAPNNVIFEWDESSAFHRFLQRITHDNRLSFSGSSFSTALVSGTFAAVRSAFKTNGYHRLNIAKSTEPNDEGYFEFESHDFELGNFFSPKASERFDSEKEWRLLHFNSYNRAVKLSETGESGLAGGLCLLVADLLYLSLPSFRLDAGNQYEKHNGCNHAYNSLQLYVAGIGQTGHCEFDLKGKEYVMKVRGLFSLLHDNDVNCTELETHFAELHGENVRRLEAEMGIRLDPQNKSSLFRIVDSQSRKTE
jgi:hypothetical protein